MKRNIFYLLVLISLSLTACASATPQPVSIETAIPEPTATEANMSLQLTSDAFANGQSIPTKYTCVARVFLLRWHGLNHQPAHNPSP